MRKLLGLAELGFTIVSLLLSTGALLPVILSGGASQGDGGPEVTDYPLIQLFFLLNYVVTFFLLVARWKKVIYLLSKDKFIWVLVGLAVVSIFWSYAPAMTLRRSIALVGTTLFGLYLATRYSLRQQLQLLGWMFGISVVLSLLFVVALPKYGIMGGIHAGSWRGIYLHKNVLGSMMAESAIIFWLLVTGTQKKRVLLWGGFSFSVILLILSTSKSPLVNLVQILATFFALRALRWRYELMVPALIAIATVGGSLSVLFTTNADALLGSIGKDATLTGRTDLWPYVLEMIAKRPWLGYGYSGFWLGLDGESAYVWRATGWTPPHAHNGLLDLWLDLGLLGVSIFLLGFGASLLRALAWVRLSKTSEGFWPMLYLTFFVLSNLTESALLKQNALIWILYVSTVLSMHILPERQTNVFDNMPNQKITVSSHHSTS